MTTQNPPFSKKSDGYKRMVELFDEGAISPDMPPKVAYQTDTIFLKYKPDAFRAGLNKYKTEKGFHIQKRLRIQWRLNKMMMASSVVSLKDFLLPIVSLTISILSIYFLTEKLDREPKTDNNMDGTGKGMLLGRLVTPFLKRNGSLEEEMTGATETGTWEPIHFKAIFKDALLRDRLGIMIVLPSGVVEKSEVTVKIENDGMAARMRVKVPECATDPNLFLLFSELQRYHRMMKPGYDFRLLAFHETMAQHRASISAAIWRDFVLALDFSCTEDIPMVELLTIQGCYYVYVELLAKEKTSYMDNNGRLSGTVVDMDAEITQLREAGTKYFS